MGLLSSIGKAVGGLVSSVTGGDLLSLGGTLLGGAQDRSATAQANQLNYEAQKEFAQNAIRWKADDARAAGISPLVAMGAPSTQFGASYVSKPNSWAQAGQDLSRAVTAKTSSAERLNERMLLTQIEGQEIENAIKRSQLVKMSAPHVPPALPSPAPIGMGGNSFDGNTIPETSLVRTRDGVREIPSAEYAQIMENYWLEPFVYTARRWKRYGQDFVGKLNRVGERVLSR